MKQHVIHLQVTDTVSPSAQGCVLAIGNFDGVHQGHVSLLKSAQDIACKYNAPTGVLTFEPHPRQYFQPLSAPFRLTPCDQKCALLHKAGVDVVFVHDFNTTLAHMTAEAFMQEVLITQLGVRAVVIGPDFHFGKGRAGHAETLRDHGIEVHVVQPVCDANEDVISATQIRSLIAQGDIAAANICLGWDYAGMLPILKEESA